MYKVRRIKDKGYAIVWYPSTITQDDGKVVDPTIDLAVLCPVNAPLHQRVAYIFPLFKMGCDLLTPLSGVVETAVGVNKGSYNIEKLSKSNVQKYVRECFAGDLGVLSVVYDEEYSLDDFVKKTSGSFYTSDELISHGGADAVFGKLIAKVEEDGSK